MSSVRFGLVICIVVPVMVLFYVYVFFFFIFYVCFFFFCQAEDGIRDLVRSRGLGDVYKRQVLEWGVLSNNSAYL